MDKQTMVHIPTVEYYSFIKRYKVLIHAIIITMGKPWKHYSMWKKPDTKGHILHDSMFIKCPKQENF